MAEPTVGIDVPCDSCGYNLRGLSGEWIRCPECGRHRSWESIESERLRRESNENRCDKPRNHIPSGPLVLWLLLIVVAMVSVCLVGTLFPFVRVTRLLMFDPHNLQELITLCTVARVGGWKVRTTRTKRTQARAYWREHGHLWETLTDFCEREKIFANLEVEGSVFRVKWPFGAEPVPGALLRMALPPVRESLAIELQKVADRHIRQ